jgi:hypothetical protein
MDRPKRRLLIALLAAMWPVLPTTGTAQEDLPYFLRDRGTGVPTSLFGTYIRKGELIVYPFYEYYYDSNLEYDPAEFGYELAQDFRGEYEANEFLLFLGLGLTDWLAFEFEAAVISASLTKSPDDPSSQPDVLEESGLGDVEAQLRWRWKAESEKSPEIFSFFETVFPLQRDEVLIGTQHWEFKLGAGVIKGFRWGTMTLRTAVGYDEAEGKVEFGEYALEYLKRLSRVFRITALIEGQEDEVELIGDLQIHVTSWMFIRLNAGVGLTSKATDIAPEFGFVFTANVF